MRFEIGLAMLGMACVLGGCANPKPPGNYLPPPTRVVAPKPYITPDKRIVGRVELVNSGGRFVVLSFPAGRVPPAGQHWRITHLGLKVGSVTISGPQREVDTVADIMDGTANVGDEATAE
jgi:hypothetical protein